MEVMVSGPLPEFVKVADWGAEVVPTVTLLNAKLVGASVTAEAVPVPVSEIGKVETEVLIVAVPDFAPIDVGQNLNEMAQDGDAPPVGVTTLPTAQVPVPPN